jgi:hypothetical protein
MPLAEFLLVYSSSSTPDQPNLVIPLTGIIDFKTGHRFNPKKYYAFIRPAPYPGGYDIKVPWELSRCQHFPWLGQAYWFTEDEKYGREFVTQIEGWIESNPWPWGVNWTCTMDVAIRVVNWLWGYQFFKYSPNLNDVFIINFFKSLLQHGRHIWRNLENQGEVTTNHYLSNLVGLVYLGILCPEFKEAEEWRTFGLQELETEMFKQVHPDGVDFEGSTAYHRLLTEMFLSATVLAQANGHTFSQPFLNRLELMVEFVMYLTKPDGTCPLIGDNDNGRLHRLKVWDPPEREWVDYRYLLAIGAVLFDREDFAHSAGDQWEEAFWLLGERAIQYKQKFDLKKPKTLKLPSKHFDDSGFFILRGSNTYLIVNAGPINHNGNRGHFHNDTLSFELFAGGCSWIIDLGLYVYTANYHERNKYRSTAYHNVIMAKGVEQRKINQKKLFYLPDTSQSFVESWKVRSDENELIIRLKTEGYSVTRRFLLKCELNSLLIEDEIETHNDIENEILSFLNIAPNIQIVANDRHSEIKLINKNNHTKFDHLMAI